MQLSEYLVLSLGGFGSTLVGDSIRGAARGFKLKNDVAQEAVS